MMILRAARAGRVPALALLLLVGLGSPAAAQDKKMMDEEKKAEEMAAKESMEKAEMKAGESMAGMSSGFLADLGADYKSATDKLTQLADAAPADKFGWKPTEDVRGYSQIFMHVAVTNYLLPQVLGLEAPPGLPNNPSDLSQHLEGLTDKAEVQERLSQSIEFANQALASLSDDQLAEKVQLFGTQMTRRRVLMIMVSHAHEHLGQAIAYARSMGVTPPWSGG